MEIGTVITDKDILDAYADLLKNGTPYTSAPSMQGQWIKPPLFSERTTRKLKKQLKKNK